MNIWCTKIFIIILKNINNLSKLKTKIEETELYMQTRTTSTCGPGCSKLTTSLVNVSLKFQTLISQIRQYFLLKKCEKLLQCSAKASLIFQQKISVLLVIKW